MKWPSLLALILVLALLIWFFFGRPIRKDAKAAHRADKDHPAVETAADDVTDTDTAAVVAEAESVTAAAADADATTEPEAEVVEPTAAEAEAPATEAPAATNGAPYAGAVLPAADGSSSDAAYSIKGSSGKKYHTTASPYYGRTKAAVYFDSEESAEAAGFVVGFKKKANA